MDADGVKKLAYLARLTVPAPELESVAHDINGIIGFVDRVQKAEADEISETPDKVNLYRDDVVAPLASAHDLVEAAPLHKDHFVQVAKVIE